MSGDKPGPATAGSGAYQNGTSASLTGPARRASHGESIAMHCRACHCITGLRSALLSRSMAVNWDDFEARREATPVYVQLANFIEAAIISGDLAPGAQIPAERRLAELVGIAAETAGKAKRLLADRGLVETGHGTGTFVRQRD